MLAKVMWVLYGRKVDPPSAEIDAPLTLILVDNDKDPVMSSLDEAVHHADHVGDLRRWEGSRLAL